MHFSSTRVMRRSVDEDNWFARTCSTYCKRAPLTSTCSAARISKTIVSSLHSVLET